MSYYVRIHSYSHLFSHSFRLERIQKLAVLFVTFVTMTFGCLTEIFSTGREMRLHSLWTTTFTFKFFPHVCVWYVGLGVFYTHLNGERAVRWNQNDKGDCKYRSLSVISCFHPSMRVLVCLSYIFVSYHCFFLHWWVDT